MKHRILTTLVASSVLGGTVLARSTEGVALPTSPVPATEVVAGHGWKAEESDNICGISDLKKVSRPAKVDYEKVLAATPQMKKIEDEGIDPKSPEGKALRKAARTLVTKSSEAVRKAESHCSVWKAISHKDGRTIPDVTEKVIERY
jgi:hypothetical protein